MKIKLAKIHNTCHGLVYLYSIFDGSGSFSAFKARRETSKSSFFSRYFNMVL